MRRIEKDDSQRWSIILQNWTFISCRGSLNRRAGLQLLHSTTCLDPLLKHLAAKLLKHEFPSNVVPPQIRYRDEADGGQPNFHTLNGSGLLLLDGQWQLFLKTIKTEDGS